MFVYLPVEIDKMLCGCPGILTECWSIMLDWIRGSYHTPKSVEIGKNAGPSAHRNCRSFVQFSMQSSEY